MAMELKELRPVRMRGFMQLLPLGVRVTVDQGSFLHIGATGSPIREKKAPIFLIQNQPVIPGSSFKGAWRAQLENLLESQFDELCGELGLTNDHRDRLKPCIPIPKPSAAEREQFKGGRRKLAGCQVMVDEKTVQLNPSRDREDKTVCPACYFFGANGLMGFLRVPNLVKVQPPALRATYDQTNIRRDRAADNAAPGALVTGEQVDPGTVFEGEVDIVLRDGPFEFGMPRKVGVTEVDHWLDAFAASNDRLQIQLRLLNRLLLPALEKVTVLGGQRSKGGGRVTTTLIQSPPDRAA